MKLPLKPTFAFIVCGTLGVGTMALGSYLFVLILGLPFDGPEWAYRPPYLFFPLLRLLVFVPLAVAAAYLIARFAQSRVTLLSALAGASAIGSGLIYLLLTCQDCRSFSATQTALIFWPEAIPLLILLPIACGVWKRRMAANRAHP
jgi:hypothetical protein